MAKLHMVDGSTVEVSKEKAQAIYNVLIGAQKPQSHAQELFCTNVSNVTFDEEKPLSKPVKGKGYKSFRKMGESIKHRARLTRPPQ